MTADLQRPPSLFSVSTDVPPDDAWHLQISPPAAFLAWLATRVPAGGSASPDPSAASVYDVASQRALATVMLALPQVPMDWQRHATVPWSTAPYPHVHVYIGASDSDGRPVSRETIEKVGKDAWLAHLDRLIEYTGRRPDLGIVWTRHGIDGIDDAWVETEEVCSELYGPRTTVVACP
ncbi:hypothetical protein [Actinomycetospora sp.]|uniref:hypothetical protein n=1 Tax=Actinomycetospora sp. TaxID=1872135 RepID=UPI002F4139ED